MEDNALEPAIRARAAARLMVIADLDLDQQLAERTIASSQILERSSAVTETHCMRLELVYHTAFGDIDAAETLAYELLARFPPDSTSTDSIRARNFAGYSLFRLRYLSAASRVFEASYDAMCRQTISNQALYCATLRTEIAITEGCFDDAHFWHERARTAARGGAPHELMPPAGLYANAGLLAMYGGRYDEAEALLFAPAKDFAMLSADRYRAVSLALAVRLRQISSAQVSGAAELKELLRLYTKGRRLGGQDSIVEALWSARVLMGDELGASALLEEYLHQHRRERGEPDWSLIHTTAADDAWQSFAPPRLLHQSPALRTRL
ncbi:hypothetical protein BH09GEM1_BH09GEM1_26970 [soil metagenome]